MKSIIWKIELAAAVLLAVSALVWGLRPGVWNYGGFYRMAAGEQGRTYTRPGCSTVEVTEDNRLRIQSPAGRRRSLPCPWRKTAPIGRRKWPWTVWSATSPTTPPPECS